ncbi:GNAT family N-acetyltransferase [Rhodocyclus tenuis]|uniref:GNAT family N-acetyltransferase n=1 Tax=Rhodocyclus tenuis TaxID=1066 RepID=UPI00190814EB|nr:GNAT family N-acetyltransferase [Rhodocyclus tenuis]MBK1680333.1 GNAT family N-acetyltransferase [Rhodocyclus tenuis]
MSHHRPAITTIAVDLSRPEHASDLLRLLDHYARDPMGGGRALADKVRATLIERLREVPQFLAYLAYGDGQAVGLINCFWGFSTFAARPLLNIHDIVVDAGWRGRGVGRQLLAAAEAAARARGSCKLTLEVLEGNTSARAAYARCGFASYELDPATGRALFMEKKL